MSQRLKRLADQIQRDLADLIRMELKDPRITGMITISAIKVSPDLGYADIYVTVMDQVLHDDMNESAHRETLDILNGASGFLRAELGRRLKTRVTPRLRFHYDTLTARGNQLNELIEKAVADLPIEKAADE